jgi:hypothetical protein
MARISKSTVAYTGYDQYAWWQVDLGGLQWIDAIQLYNRTDANADRFLCEGTLARDARGNLIFDPTSFVNKAGQTEYRARCNFLRDWDSNNHGNVPVSSPGGSFVTDSCTRGQIGPNRNCGFADMHAQADCTTGKEVRLTCHASGAAPAVLRVCEVSGQLGVGVACTGEDSLANTIVGTTSTPVRFACPAVRDARMVPDPVNPSILIPQAKPGVGGYSMYRGALGTLGPADGTPPVVTCTPG